MADKDDLVESAKIHGPSKHAHVLLAIGSIKSSHRFVPEQSFVANAFALPHVVDGDAQVDGFVDQHELPTRKLIHEVSTVQILIADLGIKIVYHSPAVRFGALRPEADFELVVEAPFKQEIDQAGNLRSGGLDLAELNLVRTEDPGEIALVFLFSPCRPEFSLDLGQPSPRRLQLVLTLFDLGLARNETISLTAAGDNQAVRVFNLPP
jgi:hypothetical protein